MSCFECGRIRLIHYKCSKFIIIRMYQFYYIMFIFGYVNSICGELMYVVCFHSLFSFIALSLIC